MWLVIQNQDVKYESIIENIIDARTELNQQGFQWKQSLGIFKEEWEGLDEKLRKVLEDNFIIHLQYSATIPYISGNVYPDKHGQMLILLGAVFKLGTRF